MAGVSPFPPGICISTLLVYRAMMCRIVRVSQIRQHVDVIVLWWNADFWVNLVLVYHQTFLQFWYPWMMRANILVGATLVPLGNLHNMQMKAAITNISFFDSNSANIPHNAIKMVLYPCFQGLWFRKTHFQSDNVFCICKIMQISAAITPNYIFAHICINVHDMTMSVPRFTG